MRKVVLAMIGLTAVIVAVFCSYSSAFGKPAAHHIPVAVAASPAVLAKLEASPALRVYQDRDLAVARSERPSPSLPRRASRSRAASASGS